MKRGIATTLNDVAKEVGVTSMTVSVVLNGSRSATRVSDSTRARIKEAAQRLHYRPNVLARGLSRRRMDTIGVITVLDMGEVNHYFLEVLNGVLEASKTHGQNTTVFSVSDWTRDQDRILGFCDGRVDGMVLIGPILSSEYADRLANQTPVVAIHPDVSHKHWANIQSDDWGGAYEATNYLISQGHTEIAHFAGPDELSGARRRSEGFCEAMSQAGLNVTETSIVPGVYNIPSGAERMTEMLAKRNERALPTAIFCASDAIAYGAMEVLAAKGIVVPDEISIIGFDDTILASVTKPAMTTVRQPFREMGHRAVEKLLLRLTSINAERGITGTAPGHHAHAGIEVVDVKLIVRSTVSCRGRPSTDSNGERSFEALSIGQRVPVRNTC